MLKLLDSRTDSLPKSDYIHTNSLELYPLVMYYHPNKENEVYTVKGYWRDATFTDGIVFVMNDDHLPHQGECLNIFHIQQGKLIHSTYHSPPSKHEFDIYIQSKFPSFQH